MVRRLPALALWLASAGLAGWLVWYGIGSIGDAGRSETSIAVAVPADTTTADVTRVSPTPVRLVVPTVIADTEAELDPTAQSGATPARPTPTNTPGPALAPTPSGATPTPAASESPQPAPASSPTPTARLSPEPTSVAVQAPIVQSFTLVGGVATVQFSASAVTVLAATPNAGYTTKISQNGATQVRVEFESDDERSRLDARWQGGPVHEIDEN